MSATNILIVNAFKEVSLLKFCTHSLFPQLQLQFQRTVAP